MLHTKTKPGHYDENDYWTVSYTKIDLSDPKKREDVVREYGDVDNAYEDYCYYKKKPGFINVKYEHHRR